MTDAERLEAIEKFTAELEQKNPDDAEILNNRGICLIYQGMSLNDNTVVRKGIADISRAASIVSKCPIINANLKWSQSLLAKY